MSHLDTAFSTPDDKEEGRFGPWMATSLGGKFFPMDPRPEDIFISDIGNGLALDCRYAGQGRIDRYYSVAEHSFHMSVYAENNHQPPAVAMATLLHDGAEGYINDLARAAKQAVGVGYREVESNIERAILTKYGVYDTYVENAQYIKELDCRMIPVEKQEIIRYPQPWAFDEYEPLDGIVIYCWEPIVAKRKFLTQFDHLADKLGIEREEWEI